MAKTVPILAFSMFVTQNVPTLAISTKKSGRMTNSEGPGHTELWKTLALVMRTVKVVVVARLCLDVYFSMCVVVTIAGWAVSCS